MRPTLVYKKYLEYLWRFGSVQKVQNMLLNRREAKQGRSRLKSLPYKVTIDPGNVCNLHCPGCHTGVKHPEMMQARMLRLPQFKTIFDQVKSHVFHISMYNWGEPFLNKELFSMVDHARENRVGTTIHSNLNHFSKAMAVDCVKSGLNHIYLSIDGATQENYHKYRQKGNLNTVLDHLATLLETRRSMNTRFPYITWKFLVFDHNRHELDQAREMARQIGVDSFEYFRATETLMDISDEAAHYRANPEKYAALPDRCSSLWSSMYVGPDGSVFPCSLAFRETEVFGNLLRHEMRDIWNNESYSRARQFFAGDGDEKDLPIPCRQCKFYDRCKLWQKADA